MTPYQRAAVHESIERMADAQEILRQQELELRLMLEEDAKADA